MRLLSRECHRVGRTAMAAFVLMPNVMTLPSPRVASFVAAVREGDVAYEALDNETARLCYQRAFDVDSTECQVLWKLARANIQRGMVAPEDEKAGWYASSDSLARRCVALYPDSSEAHFVLAVAIGQMTKVVGGKRKIELSKDVKREAETALALEPGHPGAMHVLGRWNYEVAGLGWVSKLTAKIVYGGVPSGATYEHAKEWFELAIAARPDLPLNHYWLGETLIKLHDYPGAREELQACLDLDNVLWDDRVTKAQARKRLDEIAGKK
jgi:tetratricopeptide (TPR) repeat protein